MKLILIHWNGYTEIGVDPLPFCNTERDEQRAFGFGFAILGVCLMFGFAADEITRSS